MLQSQFKLFETCRPSILNSETRSIWFPSISRYGILSGLAWFSHTAVLKRGGSRKRGALGESPSRPCLRPALQTDIFVRNIHADCKKRIAPSYGVALKPLAPAD